MVRLGGGIVHLDIVSSLSELQAHRTLSDESELPINYYIIQEIRTTHHRENNNVDVIKY